MTEIYISAIITVVLAVVFFVNLISIKKSNALLLEEIKRLNDVVMAIGMTITEEEK